MSTSPPDISWIEKGLDSCMVLSIIFSPAGNLFAGTNYGVYKSSDNGDNWYHVNQDISSNSVTCF